MIDNDLAGLYGVETKRMKEQVKQNAYRFPDHFIFELTKQEYGSLKSENVSLKHGEHTNGV